MPGRASRSSGVAAPHPDQSLGFYESLFGLHEVHCDDESIQALGPGGHGLIVFERRDAVCQTGGIDHIGFTLTDPGDIDDAVRQACGAGAKILRQGEFAPGCPCVDFEDPDGYRIEVWFE